MSPPDYLRDPAEIYRRSFETVRAETDLSRLPASLHEAAVRIVHACGMPDVVADLDWRGDPVTAGRGALAAGRPVIADSRMVAHGVIRARLPACNDVRCFLDEPGVADDARRDATTRSAAAVDRWLPHIEGAVVAIGNAPTALFRLLERLGEEVPRPAAVFAFPVGFVGAEESKRALAGTDGAPPFLTLHGRRGGSAIAAAAVNALAGGG
ncbi:MAG: precorrin-8X methylmutase [Immundisolibacterales bacterium]|nr:precorrin-8X methylmutase [Immundisolibacterales bacterium]